MPNHKTLNHNAELTLLVISYLEKYSKMPSLTLAKLIQKSNPGFSVEQLRSSIRTQRGAQGAKKRNNLANEKFADIWQSASATVEYEPITDFFLTNIKNLGVLADIHFPYQDGKALITALNYLLNTKIDGLLLNGDIIDFYQLSEFCPDPKRSRTLMAELEIVKKFLYELRSKFKGKIFYKTGNHEFRLDRYVMKRAPELWGLDCIRLENLLDFEKLNIIPIKSKSRIKCADGHLTILHGHEFGKEPLFSPVNPARGLFLKAKVNAIKAHSHQTSEHTDKNLNDQIITCWSMACLCDLRPDYRPYNSWNHGLARIQFDKGGIFTVENKRIENGKIY